MPDSMSLFAPNVNSYRRFQPDMFAPVNRRWGINNRSAGLRVPVGAEDARRIEHRVAGADANPYLALAGVLAGVHHGLANGIDPGPAAVGNVSREPDLALPFVHRRRARAPRRGGDIESLSRRRNAYALPRDEAHRDAAAAASDDGCGV
jgi:glutamine synthetase